LIAVTDRGEISTISPNIFIPHFGFVFLLSQQLVITYFSSIYYLSIGFYKPKHWPLTSASAAAIPPINGG